ncbi:MAG: DUF2220 family protein [Polaromonas sp.]|uniref:Wadjet anti-phage system protein JetD domain-containing protein n=1 Tax=Polaromonas sp. TaxID=1869339 RepID=UPI002734CC57|nr:Wadjet anti-phage system protein JetD domain-containing protein [Polaromonas sp.]MDP3796602.1 DUF2220 family protein [Polaromonas sp.]
MRFAPGSSGQRAESRANAGGDGVECNGEGGFGILDQLRGYFDHVVSFLMDRETLDAHAAVWGHEDRPLVANLHRLTSKERDLYDDLRDNRIRAGLRLEQEHIGFHWLAHRLQQLLDGTAIPH